ncbi:hypothetical protein B5M09_008234 [Aphanomyces astaci]|uniref:Protein kinase domain-containing protein n=1 Tax=Aphanomyces astaci TaxID=112090 RepID=A0A425DHH6_APHAT|nr:hypothetical protein B5M09_008234 [Aphanomyces astaci]
MSAAPCLYGSMNASRIVVAGPLCKGNVSDVCVVDSKCALVTKNISSVGIEGTITMTYVNGYKTGWDSVDAIGDLSNLLFIETNTSNIPKTLPVNLFDWYAHDLLPTVCDTGLIVGVVAIGVVILVAALCFFIRRRNRKSDAEFEYQREGGKSAGGTTSTRFITDNTATGIDMSELTLYRLNQQDVVPQKKIASGAYAHVLYGTYKGTPVAIKKLLSSRVGVSEVQGLIDEIKLLARYTYYLLPCTLTTYYLEPTNHNIYICCDEVEYIILVLSCSFTSPYVVKLVGCCWDQPSDLECVLEYMNAGDLRDNLIARTAVDFTWNEKIHVIAAIVDALAYLHSMPVIHRDLKSRNVLLDSVKSAKLTDFGVSKEDTQETMTVGVGTYRWMAPEILQVNHYSVAADMFSFGMILSELDTHNIPYADVTNPKNGKPLVDTAIMSMVIAGTIKPTFSHTMPEWVRDMAQQCIATDPEDRPTAMMLSNVVRKQIKREAHQLGV